MRSFKSANNLINNPLLQNANLKAYIPFFKKISSGLIKGIPQEVDTESISKFIYLYPLTKFTSITLNKRVKQDNQIT